MDFDVVPPLSYAAYFKPAFSMALFGKRYGVKYVNFKGPFTNIV